MKHPLVAAATLTFLALQPIASLRAENAMGYRQISDAEAAALPRNHGALGLDVGAGRQIRDRDIDFELIRVTQVRRGSPGANAGIRRGDQVIAVNGRVFGSLAAFAAYVGSMRPGSRAVVDLIPAGRGPA